VHGIAVRAYAEGVKGTRASPARRRYRCRDAVIDIACESDAHWKALAKCAGRPELAYAGDWEAARRAAPRGRLGRLLEEIFAEDPAEVWLLRLQSHGVPCRALSHASSTGLT
jgi:crotonobetainyl-CoA:carnitine CoA-transferase CaiB-like acyl-CoA transferase